MKKLIITALLLAVTANANANAEGRNDRVSVSQKIEYGIRTSAGSSGKCIAVRVNPGQSKAIFHSRIRAVYKGVIMKSKITPTRLKSRFMYKGELLKVCIDLNGNGHHK